MPIHQKHLVFLCCAFAIATVFPLTGCSLIANEDDSASLAETQALIGTYVAGTQTAEAIPEDTATPPPTHTTAPSETPMPDAPTATLTPTEIAHTLIPIGPGQPINQLLDSYSGLTGAEKRAPEGDLYESQQLLERPFDQEMTYLSAIDLRSAELARDENFIYITLYLDETVQDLNGAYAVEIDSDSDGRGDYLLWAAAPLPANWNMQTLQVWVDSNNDVGGATVQSADEPAGGDGFETLLFSAEQFTDPDLAWVRLNPDRSGSLQFAFKPALMENAASFYWRVWADAGLMNPAFYYYHDFYPIAEAGSPMADHANYPLGAVYAVDNTISISNDASGSEYEVPADSTALTPETPANLLTKIPGVIKTVIPTLKP